MLHMQSTTNVDHLFLQHPPVFTDHPPLGLKLEQSVLDTYMPSPSIDYTPLYYQSMETL